MYSPSDLTRTRSLSSPQFVLRSQTAPSEADVTAQIKTMDDAEAARLLRVERDAKLAALDWEVVKAYSNGVAVDAKLKTYMQALRDLPASANPTTDAAGELVTSSVTWPTRAS